MSGGTVVPSDFPRAYEVRGTAAIGGFAVIAHGASRFTKDIDLPYPLFRRAVAIALIDS